MHGVKISELNPTFTLNDTDAIPLWRPGPGNGSTYKILGSVFGKQTDVTALQNKATELTNKSNELDSTKLSKSGGTMTGTLVLNQDPQENMQAATKKYVDDKHSLLEKTWASLRCS